MAPLTSGYGEYDLFVTACSRLKNKQGKPFNACSLFHFKVKVQ